MQFIDLKTQYAMIKDEINANIQNVLEHGKYIMGPEIYELEKALEKYAGVKHALACSSGTDALQMALLAWGIGPGDAVFTTAFSFFATAEVIANVGAVPVFADILPDTFNMDPAALVKAIEKTIRENKLNLKAVMPVDLFGLPADYTEIRAVAEKYGLKVLEDAAQSFGAAYRGKKAGSLGDICATSFFPAKPLGCYGDGGAVFTDDVEVFEVMKSIRIHGQGENKYENLRLGINGRMDTLQAAVLLAKLRIFDMEIKMRNEAAQKYNEALEGLVTTPAIREDCVSAWAQYSVLAKSGRERAAIIRGLNNKGIPTAVYYEIPMHLQKAFAYLGYKKGAMPVAEDIAGRIFSLPMHAYLGEREIDLIAGTIRQCKEDTP